MWYLFFRVRGRRDWDKLKIFTCSIDPEPSEWKDSNRGGRRVRESTLCFPKSDFTQVDMWMEEGTIREATVARHWRVRCRDSWRGLHSFCQGIGRPHWGLSEEPTKASQNKRTCVWTAYGQPTLTEGTNTVPVSHPHHQTLQSRGSLLIERGGQSEEAKAGLHRWAELSI